MQDSLKNKFWLAVGLFLMADLLSLFSHFNPTIMPWIYGAILVGLAGIGWRRPWVPAVISLAELSVGGQGYLWFVNIGSERLSFRVGLFGLVMVLTAWHWWRSRPAVAIPVWRPVIALLAWVVCLSVLGWSKGYGLNQVWLDMNGYLYLSIIFAWAILWPKKKEWPELVLLVLLAGVTYLGFKTWVIAIIYSQQLDWISSLYRWVRNSGVGEITRLQGTDYRIFFQSHIYSLFVTLITLGGFVWGRAPRWWMWPLVAGAFATYMSLSRSLWLGLAVGLIGLVIISVRSIQRKQLLRWFVILPVGAAVWLFSTWAYQWPYIFEAPGQSQTSIAVTRLKSTGSVQASNARLNQLAPLKQAIYQSPWFGHGFGKSITYFSTDPRVRGYRTTSAFELGYLDVWLKSGLIGIGLLGWLMFAVFRLAWKSPDRWIWLGGLSALFFVHLTTPYLNHPLGLGWLAVSALYATNQR